jgi:DNA-binding transcriptional regulator YdaS (Cro superfamily)
MNGKDRFAKAIQRLPGGQREAAAVLGVSEASVSRWLDGSRCPSSRQLRAIQDLWQVPMDSWIPKTKTIASRVVVR